MIHSTDFAKYATRQARQTTLADEFCVQIDTSSGRWMVCIEKPKHYGKHRYVPMSPTKDESLRIHAAEIRRNAH